MKHFEPPSFVFGTNVKQSLVSSPSVRQDKSSVILSKICSSSLTLAPKFLSYPVTIRRGQINISIVFICVTCAENDYYRVVSARQLSFDWRSFEFLLSLQFTRGQNAEKLFAREHYIS